MEDSLIQGGFGSSISEFVTAYRLPVTIINLGINDSFVPHGSVERILKELKLDPNNVAFTVKKFLCDFVKGRYVSY